jgi:four helix bundle protein
VSVRSYKDLKVWQHAVDLVVIVDHLADKLVRARHFRMADQLIGAVLSVSSNIAEGNGRVHRLDYAHHVSMSRGSLLEVESILFVAIRSNRLSEADCVDALALIETICRMLTNLLRALYRHPPSNGLARSRKLAAPSPQSLVPSPRFSVPP